ncbi:uncharacterized protein CDV56_107949 [Aspergillus thermomutatus]|uniref:Diacetyl reductase [(S)-acetoin forming] n=2 Tax=Aspergillus subgen. Fumigati TaxID=2720872 RepID=A0A397H5Y5_ASPTH|nr:short-chain dehydrogenase [Aspergillus fischeri NRRL 181]XP_026614503.1 uncharacterized protein CDV56_107949 [Aspergillus thermomutatus]EAW24589.1 short-chain dehydrogenase [Aspergillus fischeri NRRL 181]KAG2000971.1 hypothetical protein GB937_010631 [Aspergillus fischeri]RHZ55830.1 hypothetical protein CDV56_107949 [Aspergillus thermomutatus]
MASPLTAIVTGAARGIGRSIALRLARDGYRVAINDVPSSTAEIEQFVNELNSTAVGGRSPVEKSGAEAIRAIAIPGDVTSRSDVVSMISKTVSTLGPLHLMVSNAGKAPVKPLLSSTEDDVADVFSCNFKGVFNCYTEAARQMIAQGDPEEVFGRQKYKIVGASSIAGFRAFAALGLYSATKFAVRGLTQAMALELASHKITVNAYAPGIVGTSMWTKVDEMLGQIEGRAPGESLKHYSKSIALGRTSIPDDVAGLVGGFLASEDSDYVTGQTMLVDGGIVLT